MALHSLAVILTTDDMDRSVRYYVDVLGFTCVKRTPSYSNLYRDAVRIMLGVPKSRHEWEGSKFTGQLYIHLDMAREVDALWMSVKDRTTIMYPLEDFDYGMREFGIRDDSGYALAFGAPSKNA